MNDPRNTRAELLSWGYPAKVEPEPELKAALVEIFTWCADGDPDFWSE